MPRGREELEALARELIRELEEESRRADEELTERVRKAWTPLRLLGLRLGS